MADLDPLLARAERLLDRLEHWLPAPPPPPDWTRVHAARWRPQGERSHLQVVARPHRLRLRDLQCIDRQKALIERNTRQFLAGLPANNVLLWGPRGTGKSSLIKALLNEFADTGLRLIEVDKADLVHLPDIVEPIAGLPQRFLLYCDDLSFEADDGSYKALKAVLDGSISTAPDNLLIYATSNRRHLLPEFQAENQQSRLVDGELHHGEAVEEKVSLSERFGLWLAFHPFSQDDYLAIVDHWLRVLGHPDGACGETRRAALQWALRRGSRSGRVAWQFARDCIGRRQLGDES
ncbi:MAG: ATP-binding protein [Candidatus Competibacterales bacterium]|nr:ATP-binding protein [Candidatus Competibacterales bacterium]